MVHTLAAKRGGGSSSVSLTYTEVHVLRLIPSVISPSFWPIWKWKLERATPMSDIKYYSKLHFKTAQIITSRQYARPSKYSRTEGVNPVSMSGFILLSSLPEPRCTDKFQEFLELVMTEYFETGFAGSWWRNNCSREQLWLTRVPGEQLEKWNIEAQNKKMHKHFTLRGPCNFSLLSWRLQYSSGRYVWVSFLFNLFSPFLLIKVV